MLEKEIEKKFREEVKKRGGKAYKFVSPGNSGVPDRLVVFPENKIAFVELKKPGEKPRPLQINRMKELKKFGCQVFVVDHPEQIEAVIQKILKGVRE